jgi:prepilin-type N-terminal cleavage/methylation domain-containing protein
LSHILKMGKNKRAFTPPFHKGYRRFEERAGFTFIELIIAIAIFSVIAVSIYSVFWAGLRTWRMTSPVIEANQKLRFFFDLISKDLKGELGYYPQDYIDKDKVNFEGDAKRISFWALVDFQEQDGAIHTEPARVAYYLDTADSSNVKVMRNVATRIEAFKEVPEKSEQVFSGIREGDFAFEYCYKEPNLNLAEPYEYEWASEWLTKEGEKKKMPRSVRIKLKEFTKTVFIPTGDLIEKP